MPTLGSILARSKGDECKSFGNEGESVSTNAGNYAKSKHPPCEFDPQTACEFDPQTNSSCGTLSKEEEQVTFIFACIRSFAPHVPRFGLSNVFCKK